LAMTCNDVHYAVVDLMFDIASQDIFLDVTVYDSMEVPPPSQQLAQSSRTLRRHLQEGTHQLSPTSPGCLLLRDFQKFMQTTCFCKHPNVHKLLADDSYILRKVKVGHCPQQRNYYDCGLFGIAVVLHLATGVPVHQTVFQPTDITLLRKQLYMHLSSQYNYRVQKKRITWTFQPSIAPSFMASVFPLLQFEGTIPDVITVTDTSTTFAEKEGIGAVNMKESAVLQPPTTKKRRGRPISTATQKRVLLPTNKKKYKSSDKQWMETDNKEEEEDQEDQEVENFLREERHDQALWDPYL